MRSPKKIESGREGQVVRWSVLGDKERVAGADTAICADEGAQSGVQPNVVERRQRRNIVRPPVFGVAHPRAGNGRAVERAVALRADASVRAAAFEHPHLDGRGAVVGERVEVAHQHVRRAGRDGLAQ